MYKKKEFKKLESKYSKYQDEGTVGFLMNACHKNLEYQIKPFKNKNSQILEIGAGTSPHFEYVDSQFKNYTFLENSNYSIKFLKKKFKGNKKIKYCFYKGKQIPFSNNSFDRIIISHVLEHIPEPEVFLNEMMSKLKSGGILSISLPCDPGILWRLGRFFLKLFTVKNKLGISKLEYDYMIATEHINSIFNLKSIIHYNFKKNIIKELFLPMKLKIIDLNLFYNVTLRK